MPHARSLNPQLDDLKLHDSLHGEKRIFVPIKPGEARMYVCGMTVYDYCHAGHARVLVAFDIISRWLREIGYRLTYVRNITDIDDKIIQRAAANNENLHSLTDRFIAAMHEDAEALGVLPPDFEPRATGYIEQMIEMIEKLMHNQLAYRAENGDICYAVREFPNYGKLSGKSVDDLRAGARVVPGETKRDPLDFVLWKQSKPEDPPEASWDSPWGQGRPGWHIECSAMSQSLLGEHFDIHGGGQDLQFPHHENEIAQSEGAHACSFVNYWLHNGFVRVDDEKMSKSLGNFFSIREVLECYDPEVFRFFVLRAHYRSPLNYSKQHLEDAKHALTRLYTALDKCPADNSPEINWRHPAAMRFAHAMNDDFATPEALAVLFELATQLNRKPLASTARLLQSLGGILGLLQREPRQFLQSVPPGTTPRGEVLQEVEINAQIASRAKAKKQRDFSSADRIRDALKAAGVLIEDTPEGTIWRRA